MAKQQAVSKPAVPTVSDAEQTVARLQQKREQIVAELEQAMARTSQHAYAAHAIGDLKAVEALDQITTDIARHDARVREIDLAIAMANRVLLDARQAEAQAQAREIARELLARADAIVEHARALDDANTVRVAEGAALAEELELLRALGQRIGVHVPNHQQLLALGSRAERTSMAQTPWAREVGEAIAPGERRTHSSYAQPWRDQIVKAAGALLGEENKERAA